MTTHEGGGEDRTVQKYVFVAMAIGRKVWLTTIVSWAAIVATKRPEWPGAISGPCG